ncbi:ABC transporter ATP-binding protein [Glutamicibacter sp. MNS18]|uniref:ABC transporter ATP-binding protein n=1 Tax=Glutamicibacter sp. MNS18 TaxID=2989817 RepID=UPI0022356355|nr:ABC transporter ATP-binding protein [Glutamicibacter sp. MNS18]MCW4466549.1 ABC transporter ATP-binding protein [Glutamicibacter sp. MNS18]
MLRISLEGVGKTYPGNERPSVDGVDLEVQPGEFLCLLGPSGCGKSTTLRMIAGLEHPDTGRITLGERVVDDVAAGTRLDAERRGLGLVFQNYALWPHLTVRENVEFGPAVQKLPRAERRDRAHEALATLAISELAERYPSALSGGQQQRVAIARTLAARPQIMLLDEPLSNLDARLRLEMRAEFQRLHRQTGNTMVFVTHDQFEAMTLATRIVVMDQGRIQQVGTPLEIYNRPANRFVAQFMGNPPINILERGEPGAAAQRIESWFEARGLDVASAGIRPEDLRLQPQLAGPDALDLQLEVSALLPTGGSWIIELGDGTRRFFATSQQRPEVTCGQRITAWAASQHIHLFDRAGMRHQPLEVAA